MTQQKINIIQMRSLNDSFERIQAIELHDFLNFKWLGQKW